MKRQVTDEQLRELIRARKTKGSAFMLSHEEYEKIQRETRAELAALSRSELFARYQEYVYDVR